MVVGQVPFMPSSAISPPLHFPPPMLPATAQSYPVLPQGTTLNSQPFEYVTSTMQPPSPVTPPGSPPVLPQFAYSDIPMNGNALVTMPTNLYPSISVMPISPAVTFAYKMPDNQISPPVTNLVPFNSSPIFSYSPPMAASNILPSQPRSINQCTSGLCIPGLPTEMCSVQKNNSHLINPAMSIAQTVCAANVVSPWKQSYGMEQVWRKEFHTLFYTYSGHSHHVWNLLPVTERPGGVWYENVDSAKVRFCCVACGHAWTSMKGRVAFWFILNCVTNEGIVCLKLYGQQCDKCKKGTYEPAMWYPEEVTKVLANIYHKVGEVYYGFMQAPFQKTRRPGKPRTPHNSDLCQACQDGVCAERR